MPQQYRNRGDAENGFDELKNQWGWCGFNSRLLAPSRLSSVGLSCSTAFFKDGSEENGFQTSRQKPHCS